jgi:hypothetical protein
LLCKNKLERAQVARTTYQKHKAPFCRFNFDWDAKEDTYEARLTEGSLLFGRGLRAGVDQRSQRENAAHREQTYLSQMRKARGELTSAADVAADVSRAQRAAHVDDDPVSTTPTKQTVAHVSAPAAVTCSGFA